MPCLSGYEAPPPLLGSPPPPPQTHPPPLKMVREWEGVGVWPVATAPPWWRPLPFMAFCTLHDVLCEGKVVCIRLQLGYRPPINSTKHICRHGLFPSAQLIMWVLFLTRLANRKMSRAWTQAGHLHLQFQAVCPAGSEVCAVTTHDTSPRAETQAGPNSERRHRTIRGDMGESPRQ